MEVALKFDTCRGGREGEGVAFGKKIWKGLKTP